MGKELVFGKMTEIREMKACDVAQIAEIERLCFSDPWSENSVSSELGNPLSYWLVAWDGKSVIGYVGSQTVLDSADMMNLAVLPEYRRCGIGKRLVTELCGCLSQRGVNALLLEVRASNDPAISLYEKMGFTRVGCRKNYYSKPKEDALILRKELHRENSGN